MKTIPAGNMPKPFTGYENFNLKGWDGPPYSYSVTVRGKKKTMSGFDEEHIRAQIFPQTATRIIKLKDDTKRV